MNEKIEKLSMELEKEQEEHNDMKINKQMLDGKLMEQKKSNDTKISNMNELREEEKVTLKGVQKRFEEAN